MRKAVRAIVIKEDKLLVMKRNKFGHLYYTLIGGGVKWGERLESALAREVQEECSMSVSNPRLVFIENAGMPYGTQYIFKCKYISGDPHLDESSDEAEISRIGQNIYQPTWLRISDLAKTPFRSSVLRDALLLAFQTSFPEKPKNLTSSADISYT